MDSTDARIRSCADVYKAQFQLLDNAGTGLDSQQSVISLKECDDDAQRLRREVQSGDRDIREAEEKVAKHRGKASKKGLFSFKSQSELDEKVSYYENRLKEISNSNGVKKQQLSEAEKKLQLARQTNNSSAKRKLDWDIARTTVDSLFLQHFIGNDPAYTKESGLRTEVQTAQMSATTAEMKLQQNTQVSQLLTNADSQLQQAGMNLQRSLSANTVGMVSNSMYRGPMGRRGMGMGRGPMMRRPMGGQLPNLMISSGMGQARQHVEQARALIAQAQTINPAIPNMSSVRVDDSFLMFNIIFNSMLSEIILRTKIMESYQRVMMAHSSLKAVVDSMNQMLETARAESAAAQARLELASQSLWNERMAVVKNVIGGEGTANGVSPAVKLTSEAPAVALFT